MDNKSHYLGPTRSKDKNVSDGTEKRIDYTIALLLTIDNDTKKMINGLSTAIQTENKTKKWKAKKMFR